MGRLSENSVLNIKNKSHAVTAQVDIPQAGGAGVIVAQGGAFGGWTLYLHQGRPTYCYNLLGLGHVKVTGDAAVPAGEHQIRMEFAYDGGGLGKGGNIALYLDGTQVADGRLDMSIPMVFSADETTDVGSDCATRSATTTAPKTVPSPAACAGSRSTSATMPRTPTI